MITAEERSLPKRKAFCDLLDEGMAFGLPQHNASFGYEIHDFTSNPFVENVVVHRKHFSCQNEGYFRNEIVRESEEDRAVGEHVSV